MDTENLKLKLALTLTLPCDPVPFAVTVYSPATVGRSMRKTDRYTDKKKRTQKDKTYKMLLHNNCR